LLLFLRALLEGKSIENPIQGTWASVHEAYVAVVTATTLLLKLDAQVYNWASKGTSLEGQAHLSSWLFLLLRCKMSLILPKHLYGITVDEGLIECGKAHKWFTDYSTSELVTVYKGGHLRDTMRIGSKSSSHHFFYT